VSASQPRDYGFEPNWGHDRFNIFSGIEIESDSIKQKAFFTIQLKYNNVKHPSIVTGTMYS
jgi:hypothetical protein